MTLTRGKYRRLTDLFVVGKVLPLPDGEVLWVQALNPWEKQEALQDGQTARARVSLAVNDPDSDDFSRLRAKYEEMGSQLVVEEIIGARQNLFIARIAVQMRGEEEWEEITMLIERSDDLVTTATPEEQEALLKASGEYAAEMQSRLEDKLEAERRQLSLLNTEDLWKEFKETYVEQIGGGAAMAEFRLAEIAYATRLCGAVREDGGDWDHGACESHLVRLFADKMEVKSLPEELLGLLIETVLAVTVEEVQAKNSRRQQGSSPSSLLPSVEEGSTPSTPTATQEAPLPTS